MKNTITHNTLILILLSIILALFISISINASSWQIASPWTKSGITVSPAVSTDSVLIPNLKHEKLTIKRTATATNYTIVDTDYIVAVTNTAAARTITIPSAISSITGRVVRVVDESGGAATNNITIDTEGAAKIIGADTFVISDNYNSVALYSNGTDWFIP